MAGTGELRFDEKGIEPYRDPGLSGFMEVFRCGNAEVLDARGIHDFEPAAVGLSGSHLHLTKEEQVVIGGDKIEVGPGGGLPAMGDEAIPLEPELARDGAFAPKSPAAIVPSRIEGLHGPDGKENGSEQTWLPGAESDCRRAHAGRVIPVDLVEEWPADHRVPKRFFQVKTAISPRRNPSMSRLLPLLLTLCLIWSGLPATAPAQNIKDDLGTVKPTYSYQKYSIVVLPFNASNAAVESAAFPRIIRRDLELSGFFKMVENMQQANFINRRDDVARTISYDDWMALGAEYTLRGNVAEEGGNYRIIVQMYDIKGKRQIINRTFTDRKERMRDLAHQISDAVIFQIKGIQGVCRTKLLFVTEQLPGVKEIAMVDADGFNAHMLTSLGKLATTPTWGSKGTEMYFSSYHGNRANVYGMQFNVDPALNYTAGSMWTIAAYGGTNSVPAWNDATGRIALMVSKDGNAELYTSRRDGSDLKRLTQTTFTEGSPTWSPDGTKVAFTSNDSGGVHIFVMNADGSGRRRLTNRGRWNDAVSWSPDGKRLLFVSRNGGVNDIFICDVSGSDTSYRRLTQNQGNNESPCWAPNSTHIAFSSNRTGQWQLYMMLDDGSNQCQLTTTGRNTLPDWGPIPPTASK